MRIHVQREDVCIEHVSNGCPHKQHQAYDTQAQIVGGGATPAELDRKLQRDVERHMQVFSWTPRG